METHIQTHTQTQQLTQQAWDQDKCKEHQQSTIARLELKRTRVVEVSIFEAGHFILFSILRFRLALFLSFHLPSLYSGVRVCVFVCAL